MTFWLKQNTAATVKMGPFLDDVDGKTPETGLTILQADIRLSKNGGDTTQSNNVSGAIHDENGYYDVPLDTTDTNTRGTLMVFVHKSGALPVWNEFMVAPANVFDSLFGTELLLIDDTNLASLINGISGAGAILWEVNVSDGLDPLNEVDVWVTTDANGSNVIARGSTDVFGNVTFMLDAGSYYFWKQLAGYSFTNPQIDTVA